MAFFVNTLISACLIGFCAWLSKTKPHLAGFIVAMPLTTLIVLPLAQMQSDDSLNTIKFAQGILVALPISVMFFLPFLFSNKFSIGFWASYAAGFVCLILGYFIHKWVMTFF